MSACCTLENVQLQGALGCNAFHNPWIYQVSYVFPPLVLYTFLEEHVTGHIRLLILHVLWQMEAPLHPIALNIPYCCPIVKRSCQGYLTRLSAQGSAIAAFNPLAALGLLLHRHQFFSSVCPVVIGQPECLQQRFTSSV